MGERPNWDEYFKNIVTLTSIRSSCPILKVGCLFVKDNRIIAQGYNGHICGCQHKTIMRRNHNIEQFTPNKIQLVIALNEE